MRSNTKQTKINFYTNILALIANVLVGIYYTPYLVKSLGLSAYGVLPLALIINQYIGVATQTLTHAYTRFYSVDIQKGDYLKASKDISTSLVVVTLISFLIIPIGICLIISAGSIFTIPAEILDSTRILFGYTILSFLASLLSSMLNVTLYAINRLDQMNVMKIIRTVLKLVLVVLFFQTIRIDVSLVGLANLLTEILILLLSVVLFFKYKPNEVKLSYKHYDKSILIAIMGMSVWVLVQLCGDTLLYRTDNLVVNHYWGTVSSGVLGAISEIGNYVSIIVSVIGSLFGPLILMQYAKGNHDEVKSLFIEQSTIVGCLSAILTGVISGCGFYILKIWLGGETQIYDGWLLLKMVVLPFYAAGGILAFVYRSWNKVKRPAIGTICLGLIDILLVILICEYMNSVSIETILLICAFFSIAQCFVLNAYCVIKIYPECKISFIPISLKISGTFLLCFIVSNFAIKHINPTNLIELGATMAVIALIMLFLTYFFMLNKTERKKIISITK